MSWVDVGPADALPERGARVVRVGGLRLAVFKTGAGEVFALEDRCPHRGGPLSQGIVHGRRVTCPLHDWVIDLASGEAVGADVGCTLALRARVERGRVSIDVPDAPLADVVRGAGAPHAAASTAPCAAAPIDRD